MDRPKEKSMDGTQKSVRIASGIQQQTPYMCTAEEVGAIEKSYRGLKAALNTSQGSGGQTGLASGYGRRLEFLMVVGLNPGIV